MSPMDADVPLDYYLIYAAGRGRGTLPLGILVEEFVLCDDYTAAGIDCAEWTAECGEWRESPGSSRAIRADPALRDRVLPVTRRDARETYSMLGGGALPEEAELRAFFRYRQALPAAAPLDLGGSRSAQTRRYRILFAGELGERGLANVSTVLRLEPPRENPRARIAGTATATADGHTFTWELRRIGPGIAWCLDVTVRLSAGPLAAIGALLHHHRQAIRGQGLIPVTIERFA